MEGILHDPAYLLGSSYLPQLTCFPLANFFEILYNRINMMVYTGINFSYFAALLYFYAPHHHFSFKQSFHPKNQRESRPTG